jgi:hypothetical protein
MSDRFDLEQQIMSCWNIVEDLKLLSESQISEADRKAFINGLIVKYELKFDKMFNTFEDCVHARMFDTKDQVVDFDGLETAYDEPFNVNVQDLNGGYYPGN